MEEIGHRESKSLPPQICADGRRSEKISPLINTDDTDRKKDIHHRGHEETQMDIQKTRAAQARAPAVHM